MYSAIPRRTVHIWVTLSAKVTEHLGGDVALQYSSGIGASDAVVYINDMSRDDARANDPFFQHMQLSYTSKLHEMGTSQFVHKYIQHESKQVSNEIRRQTSSASIRASMQSLLRSRDALLPSRA